MPPTSKTSLLPESNSELIAEVGDVNEVSQDKNGQQPVKQSEKDWWAKKD